MTTFAEAKQTRDTLERDTKEAAAKLNAICEPHKNAMGLTPDRIKSLKEYHNARVAFNIAFDKFRNFNAVFTKQFRKELLEERRQKQEEREALAQKT